MIREKAYDVRIESVDDLFQYWAGDGSSLNWCCLFTIPPWLKAWQQTAGRAQTASICVFRDEGRVAGIAPFAVQGRRAFLMGDARLCDYGDVIAVPGAERKFASALLAFLRRNGITTLDMGRVRTDSPNIAGLIEAAKAAGWDAVREPAGNTYELALAETWQEYLDMLTGKERHEVRRKMRRIKDAGALRFRCIEGGAGLREGMDVFLDLFRTARGDKGRFMTEETESFFRMIAGEMNKAGLLKLFVLDVDSVPLAAALCFDYRSTVYLYNSGYDRNYSRLSAGLMCKVMSIRHSIGLGRSTYSFLSGDERYKERLGGRPMKLEHIRVILT